MTDLKDFTKISVLDKGEITKAIFGKTLPLYTKTNPFAYVPSAGYYDKNLVAYNVGFVFNTPSGRESKAYPYIKIAIKEDVISGECEWVSDNGTPKKIHDKIQGHLCNSKLDLYFKGYRLKKKYDSGIKYLVVSSGSGGSECYKLELEDI